MPREIQKMAFAVLIFSEGFGCELDSLLFQSIGPTQTKMSTGCPRLVHMVFWSMRFCTIRGIALIGD